MNSQRRSSVRADTLSFCIVGLLAVALVAFDFGASDPPRGAANVHDNVRLEVTSAAGMREWLLALRVYNYRWKDDGDEELDEVYVDTPGWHLAKQGYVCALRRGVVDGDSQYQLRLVRASSAGAPQTSVLEVTLPAEIGPRLVASEPDGSLGAELIRVGGAEFAELCERLEINPQELAHRARGECQRRSYRVHDDGVDWFIMEQENWTLTSTTGSQPRQIQLVHLKPLASSPDGGGEMARRLISIQELSRMVHGVRPAGQMPIWEAIRQAPGQSRRPS